MGFVTSALKQVAPIVTDPYTGKVTGIFDYETALKVHPNLKKEDYTSSDTLYASMATYKDNWEAYQRASYRNPRIAESASEATRALNAKSDLGIPTDKRTTKTTGTGLNNVGTTNPFGNLGTGLGI